MPRKKPRKESPQKVEQQRGKSLRDHFLSGSPTTPEQSAEQIANELAAKIRDALDQTLQKGGNITQAMAEEIVNRGRDLTYSVALREMSLPPDKTGSTEQDKQDENAIKDIGKLLIKVTGLRGAPVKKGELAIQALERHLSKLEWSEIVEELCDCGKSKHDPKCKGRIQSRVNDLLAVLRKYEIANIPPLDQRRSQKIKEGSLEQRESKMRQTKMQKKLRESRITTKKLKT